MGHPSRLAAPKTKREILLNVRPYEKRIAILEDGRLSEIFYERPDSNRMVGNVYKGVVNAVLPGLQAAFVDIGLDKAGFLHVEDVIGRPDLEDDDDEEDEEDGRHRQHRRDQRDDDANKTIDQLLKVGQEILVQVTKEPISTKGPRLTTHLSFAGRFLVCMPGTSFIGVSKKLRDPQARRRLKRLIRELKSPDVGYIVRTNGLNESESEFGKQMNLLQAKWEQCKSTQSKVQAPTLVHQESDSSETTLRDYFHDEVDSVWVDDKEAHKTISSYLGVLSADQVNKVKLYTGDLSLFDHFGIEEELEKTFMRKVPLKRGGYLVIDRAEALTAIDVNTGGKVRGRDQAKNILETNMDSAWEVAKQMRLRDLGGLIVIDFIDMEDEESRENVVKEFKKAIRQDKSPISFSSISQFGLMEVTRKRIRPDAVQEQSNACPTCHGAGYVPSKESVVGHIDRWLRRFRAKKGDDQLSLVLHPDMITHVLANRAAVFKYWERMHKCRIQLVEDDDANFAEYRFFNRQNDDITASNTLT